MPGRSGTFTKRGPGRVHLRRIMPAGTKLIRRFIKDARGEALEYRKDLMAIIEADRKRRLVLRAAR